MASATLTRLESLLAARRLDSTIARQDADAGATLVATGITSLDTSLGGGWRRGEISEVLGQASSGRASVLCATLAAATARGELVALVDTFDRVDPVTAAAAGLDLSRVLWVRGPSITPTTAVSRRDSVVGPAVLRAVRACDLIIRAGGFGVVALDLAGAPAAALRDLASSTWMRLAHANAGQQTVCLLVGDQPMGRSARGVSVRLTSVRRWSGSSPQSRRFAGFEIQADLQQARRLSAPASTWSLRAAG
jgi:recombination protein RecA